MGCSVSVPAFAFAFLTVNSVLALYRVRGDAAAVAFVVSAYVLLVLLLLSLRRYEAAPPARRSAGRVVVWLLAAALNSLFAWHVASVMPPEFSAAVWTLTALATGAGFYVLFLLQ
ncbi:hypothetical protein Taro_030901 [Colocasia esculenta]|uniref:Uncharacterized protein n=1 Tax=Colocasia esculenta TaxID=4460 RepID=A0A843VQD0_COLES|nr:hypothetical protein [Colocasia esculenta]